MSNYACSSNYKNGKERSLKFCVCGGHNHHNPKRNKRHHSTSKKLSIKKIRKLFKIMEVKNNV